MHQLTRSLLPLLLLNCFVPFALAETYSLDGVFTKNEHVFNGSTDNPNLKIDFTLNETARKVTLELLLTMENLYGISSAEVKTITFTKKKVGSQTWLFGDGTTGAPIDIAGDYELPVSFVVKGIVRGSPIEFTDFGRVRVEHSGAGNRLRGRVPALQESEESHFFLTNLFNPSCATGVKKATGAGRKSN